MAATITPSPLPALLSLRVQNLNSSPLPDLYTTYDMILQAEQHAVVHRDMNRIISARIMGYLLLEFHERSHIFGDAPCSTLVKWITSKPQEAGKYEHDAIYSLGTRFRDNFIGLFKTSNAPYQTPSSHPSRPSFETLEDMIKDALEPAVKDNRAQRRKALARDGFRCMVTGMLDHDSVRRCQPLLHEAQREAQCEDITMTEVQTAQILREPTMQGIDPERDGEDGATMKKTHCAAAAIAILDSFGFSDFAEDFRQSGGVHQIWNLLSLEPHLHKKFDFLEMWFEATQKPHCYKICVLYQSDEGFIRRNFMRPRPHVDGAPMVVDFTPRTENAVSPPDPCLLALHAACARVAHMSGAARFIDQVERDVEETKVLACDGTSAPLLSHLLAPFAIVEVTG